MRWGEIIRRLVLVPPTLFGVAAIVFVLLRVVPGDPIAMMIPPGASTEDIVRLRALYGLDQPIASQFIVWLGQMSMGDFGRSISLHQRVFELVTTRLPATLELALLAVSIALLFGIGVALLCSLVRGRRVEWLVDTGIGLDDVLVDVVEDDEVDRTVGEGQCRAVGADERGLAAEPFDGIGEP